MFSKSSNTCVVEFLSCGIREDGPENGCTDKSREGLSTSVSRTDGAVGDAVRAGTSAQHRPHWLTSDWEESVPNPVFTLHSLCSADRATPCSFKFVKESGTKPSSCRISRSRHKWMVRGSKTRLVWRWAQNPAWRAFRKGWILVRNGKNIKGNHRLKQKWAQHNT